MLWEGGGGGARIFRFLSGFGSRGCRVQGFGVIRGLP